MPASCASTATSARRASYLRRDHRPRHGRPPRTCAGCRCRSARSPCSARATSPSPSEPWATTPARRSPPGARWSRRRTRPIRRPARSSRRSPPARSRLPVPPTVRFGLVAGFEAGECLVRAPEVAAVAFTGSQHGRPGVVATRHPAGRGHPRVRRDGHREPGRDDHRRRGPDARRSPPGSSPPSPSAPASSAPSRGSSSLRPGTTSRPASRPPCRARGRPAGCSPRASPPPAAPESPSWSAPGPRCSAGFPVRPSGWSADATVLAVPAADLKPGSRLLEECFGPVALVAEYADQHELTEVLEALQGALAASVMSAGPEDPETPGLVGCADPAGRTGRGRRLADRGRLHLGAAARWTVAGHDRPVRHVGRRRRARPVHPAGDVAVGSGLGASRRRCRRTNPWRLPRRVDGRLVP